MFYISTILSLDQAKDCGWAVFEKNTKKLMNYGDESFQKYKDYDDAIFHIKIFMIELIKQYDVEFVTIEDIYSMNKQVYGKLAKLQGVLINCLLELEIDFKVIPAVTWKSYLKISKGSKTKRKEEKKASVQFVKDKFGVEVSNNTSDAICMGYYILNSK